MVAENKSGTSWVRYVFSSFFKNRYFLERTSFWFFKSPLSFFAFLNWDGPCTLSKNFFATFVHVKQQISLSDCNWTRTQNHLVRKRTLNHLPKLAKWLSCVLSTYLYGAFDSMFLSCHVRGVSEWIHTL